MPEHFGQDLSPGACRHGLLYKISVLVDEQAIAPKDAYVIGLTDEMRLVWNDDRREPTRLWERNQTAFARNVARQVTDNAQKRRIAESRGKGNPLRLVHVIGEGRGIAKFRPSGGDRLPQCPGPAFSLAFGDRRRIHQSETRGFG